MLDTYLIGDNQKLEDGKWIANFAPSGKVKSSSNLFLTPTDAQSKSIQLEKIMNTEENEQLRNMLAMLSILSFVPYTKEGSQEEKDHTTRGGNTIDHTRSKHRSGTPMV